MTTAPYGQLAGRAAPRLPVPRGRSAPRATANDPRSEAARLRDRAAREYLREHGPQLAVRRLAVLREMAIIGALVVFMVLRLLVVH